MNLYIFLSMVDAPIGQSSSFILRLSAWPFLRPNSEADPPPFCFLPRLARSDSDHYCFVLQGLSQHLGYLLALASHPCLIWKFT